MGKWPSKHRKIEKSGNGLAAEKTLFPQRWYGGVISANLEVIWEMSVEETEEMNTSDRGLKHVCPECATKYYDLKKKVVACPRCGAKPQAILL